MFLSYTEMPLRSRNSHATRIAAAASGLIRCPPQNPVRQPARIDDRLQRPPILSISLTCPSWSLGLPCRKPLSTASIWISGLLSCSLGDCSAHCLVWAQATYDQAYSGSLPVGLRICSALGVICGPSRIRTYDQAYSGSIPVGLLNCLALEGAAEPSGEGFESY